MGRRGRRRSGRRGRRTIAATSRAVATERTPVSAAKLVESTPVSATLPQSGRDDTTCRLPTHSPAAHASTVNLVSFALSANSAAHANTRPHQIRSRR